MSVDPNVVSKKRKKSESKPQSQLNKCLNEKRRREQENIYIEELAELISASTSDMSSLSVKPDKCAILQETVNQIHRIKQEVESGQSDELQQSEVSSSKSTILADDIVGPLLLEALDGFLFVVNTDGKIEFVSENIPSFLKYSEDNLVEKSIYDIIHIGDHARFSSSLLPISVGNGFGWTTEPNCGSTKNRSFNCRFLIKPPDDQKETMEEKQTRVAQYENMQISAVLLPFSGEKTEPSDSNNEVHNRLLCVARRIPPNEKNTTSVGVEQFTTRLDVTGKILAIDTSGVSSPYKQFLDKDLVGHLIHDFCHSSDSQKLSQHLKDTLQAGSSTSGIYRLQVAQDKYVHVHTKSKRFSCNQMVNNEQEFIMATHSIIKESDGPLSLEGSSVGNRQNPSPVTSVSASGTSGPGAVSFGSSSINGGITSASGSPLTVSSYTFPALSPNSNEFGLNELVLNMFPTPSWELDSGASRDSEGLAPSIPPTSIGGCGHIKNASPQHTPATNCSSGNSRGPLHGPQQQQPSSSAFSPELMASGKGSPRTQSPAAPGRVTPFTNAFSYSPVQAQPSSGKASPSSASSVGKKGDDVAAITELSGLSPATSVSGLMPDTRTTQKLRDLLTQGLEEVDSSPSKSSSVEGNTTPNSVISDCDANTITRISQSNPGDGMNPSSGNENVILRELLNQDDDELSDIGKSMQRLSENKPVSLQSSEICKNETNLENQKKLVSTNNMLRKLLNNDEESDRNYRKSQDLIHLLKSKSPDKVEPTSGTGEIDSSQTHRTSETMLKQLALDSSSSPCMPDVSLTKRKSPEERAPSDSAAKRPSVMVPHAHLAGQNPMLASMLAQTPRTPPSVPTSIANSIISQLPQERLPKNLEKKLVHTPFSGNNSASTNTPPTQTQTTSRLTVTSLQQEVVNSDSRGHITLAQHHSINSIPSSSGLSINFSQAQAPQGFLSKMLTSSENSHLSQSFATPVSTSATLPINVPQQQRQQLSAANTGGFGQFSRISQPSQNLVPNATASSYGLRDMLGEATQMENSPEILATQSSDPLLSEILDQVWSMQQEMNMEASSADDTSLLKILDEVLDPPAPSPSPHTAVATEQDMNEKMAISAIQRHLMSFEGPARTTASPPNRGSVPLCNLPTARQASGIPSTVSQLSPNSMAFSSNHFQSGPQPPSYNSSVVIGQRPRLPQVVPSGGGGGGIMTNNQTAIGMSGMSRVGLPQYANNNIAPQVIHLLKLKKSYMDKCQKLYLQQQQKRLLEQQQKQHLTMQTQQPVGDSLAPSGTTPFPENMTELLNNTVAPNVTLQRSNSMPEQQQLSPRYSINMSSQLPSPVGQPPPPPPPSQLSPSQRVNQQSPYSPMSQQPFSSPNPPTTSYQQTQQHRLSPHSISSYPQGGPSHSTSPVPSGVTGGSRSPHLQLSPQQGSVPPQWNQRPPQSPIQNNLQQQNPMLNAQLSQSAYNGQPRFSTQQRSIQMRSMPSPSSLQPSRNSPFPGQPEGTFSPLSPVAVYQGQPPPTQQQQQQSQQQQQRLQRAMSVPGRVNSPRTPQGGFVGREPLLSPQPQPSPSYSQSLPGTPATNFPSGSGLPSGNPAPNYSLAQDNTHFPFDQQSLQAFTSTAGDRVRAGSGSVSSEYVRQELRAIVGARTQQQQQQQQQQHHTGQTLQQHQQSMHQLRLRTTTPPTGPPSSQSLSRNDLEALGLSLEIGPGDGSPSSPAIYSQSLLSIVGSQEAPPGSHACITSPRMEDAKPSDQKKSLLQQLLSEPT